MEHPLLPKSVTYYLKPLTRKNITSSIGGDSIDVARFSMKKVGFFV
jgi:hypothetical protein